MLRRFNPLGEIVRHDLVEVALNKIKSFEVLDANPFSRVSHLVNLVLHLVQVTFQSVFVLLVSYLYFLEAAGELLTALIWLRLPCARTSPFRSAVQFIQIESGGSRARLRYFVLECGRYLLECCFNHLHFACNVVGRVEQVLGLDALRCSLALPTRSHVCLGALLYERTLPSHLFHLVDEVREGMLELAELKASLFNLVQAGHRLNVTCVLSVTLVSVSVLLLLLVGRLAAQAPIVVPVSRRRHGVSD